MILMIDSMDKCDTYDLWLGTEKYVGCGGKYDAIIGEFTRLYGIICVGGRQTKPIRVTLIILPKQS